MAVKYQELWVNYNTQEGGFGEKAPESVTLLH